MKQYKDIDELNAAVESGEINTPLKAIRAKCLDCSVYQPNEVKECYVKKCPLYAFRSGKDPYRKRTLTEEQRQKLREEFNANVKSKNQAKS